jgi:hypothetical protein
VRLMPMRYFKLVLEDDYDGALVSLPEPRRETLVRLPHARQAFDFAQRLNRTASITYSTKQLTDEEAQELSLDDNTEAFSLTLALAAKD